jgi:hypothetical protein
MALHLFGYELRALLRNRQSQFFALALPVLFLVIFASVFGGSGNTTQVAGGRISTSVYYVPGIIALGVIAACFGNLMASVTALRERGVLKRRRATPVPAAAFIAGRVLTAVVIAVVMARRGPAFAATWALAMGTRVVFIWALQDVRWFAHNAGPFLRDHQIGRGAIAAAFVLIAVTMYGLQFAVIAVRVRRLPRPRRCGPGRQRGRIASGQATGIQGA